jgi:hypothetical protein
MYKVSSFLLVICFLSLFACNRRDADLAKQVELNGINGPAYYVLSRDEKEIIGVIKIEYLENLCCDVTINSDTLKIGEKFVADIIVRKAKYKIIISEPTPATITGSFGPDNFPQKSDGYFYTPVEPGLYNFRCRVEYDTVSVPYEYKFIVLPKQ